ncbi:MAG: peptidylprolyl isomerase, partial [Ignavibacteriaceae bacterium]
IIKVTDKRERVPQIKASHILIDYKNDAGQIDSVAARARIDSIFTKAKSDSDFAKLAEEYSEDPGSKGKGGDLGFIQRRTTVKEFDEAAFNLKNIGDISDVVKTQFGYHIIKLTDKKPYPTYDEEKEELTNLFKKQRYQTIYDNFIDSLRTKYNYKLNDETFNAVLNGSDSLKVGGDHPKMDEIKDKALFSYAGKNVKVEEFFPKMSSDQDFVNRQLNADLLKKAINKISGDYLLEEEALNLEKKDPVFADLMEDYKNGIYIFKLQEDEVWNKINVDSTELYSFYNKTKEKYVWPDRIDFSEIFSKSDSLINRYYSLLQSGENFDSLAAKYTERPGYKEKAGNFGLQDAKQTQLASEADKLANPGDYSKPFKNSGGYSIVRLNAKDPSREKSFEEAKPEVSGAFQEAQSKKLEENYVENLKKIYKPVFYYDELSKAYKTE